MWWCVGGGGGGGYVHGMGEEKVIDDFACPFAWSLHITCRESLQKDRGWGDVFIEGCVCGNGRRGGKGGKQVPRFRAHFRLNQPLEIITITAAVAGN